MVIEEIHSYFIYEDRGTIHVEFTLNEGDRDGDYELEIPLEELEELCDLFNQEENELVPLHPQPNSTVLLAAPEPVGVNNIHPATFLLIYCPYVSPPS